MKKKSNIGWWIAGLAGALLLKKKAAAVEGIGATGIGAKDWGAYAEYVNKPRDGRYSYVVKLWCGSGYMLDLFVVYADDEEEALERLVAYLEKTKQDCFFVDDWADELSEEEMDYEGLYIDATMEGARQPHYLRAENLAMKAIAKEDLPYNIKDRNKYGTLQTPLVRL